MVMIYYYTGTGNSLWTARALARGIGDSDLIPMSPKAPDETRATPDAVGLVFPVHIWGMPRRVVEFVNASFKDSALYYFAVALNAGQVAATLLQLKKMLARKGAVLSAGYEIAMPSNYIPWGGPGPEEKKRFRFAAAAEKVRTIAAAVRNRRQGPIEKGPLWQNILFTFLNRISYGHVPEMDKRFWTDATCNGCGICEAVCPNANIRMEADKPVWLHRCEQCLACIQWCPQEALQFGKKTPRYQRYHHPEITLKDVLSTAQRIKEGVQREA
jgi:ferredoxin